MKVRNGFVSNSSSSSFVCLVCGNNESGMDLSLEDAGMRECVLGHIFCCCHTVTVDLTNLTLPEKREKLKEYYSGQSYCSTQDKSFINGSASDELVEDIFEEVFIDFDSHDVPCDYCPICQFKSVSDSDLVKWFYATNPDIDEKRLLAMWKEQYGNYPLFAKAIQNVKE